MRFSIWELLVILVIVALLFGTRKLGTIGEDLGKAIKGFRNAVKDQDNVTDDTPRNGTVIEKNDTEKTTGSEK